MSSEFKIPYNNIPLTSPPTYHRTINVDGLNLFYRESGTSNSSVILLLHGFPTSSHMFRNLIPLLSNDYHVIAPDFPGFGFTQVPKERKYVYTFDNITNTIKAFIEALAFKSYSLYIFDYGSPIGLRLAISHPERINSIISQNGNAYEEGLSEAWKGIKQYLADPLNESNIATIRGFLTLEAIKWQYTEGFPIDSTLAPESYYLDYALIQQNGNEQIQLDLLLNYATNISLYPKFQEYLRVFNPPLLVIWGKYDPFFIPAGAQAFKKDNPNTIVQLLETGHFALESHSYKIAEEIKSFLKP